MTALFNGETKPFFCLWLGYSTIKLVVYDNINIALWNTITLALVRQRQKNYNSEAKTGFLARSYLATNKNNNIDALCYESDNYQMILIILKYFSE